MDIHIDYEAILVSFESDESGETTAFNDDLGVMAIGPDEETARARFHAALTRQVAHELSQGRPLPDPLRAHVRVLVGA